MNRSDTAEEILRRAYKKTKDSYYIEMIADSCFDNGDYSGAARWYRKCDEHDDKEYDISLKLAKTYLLNKRLRDAKKIHMNILANINKNTARTACKAACDVFNYALDAPLAVIYMKRVIEYAKKDDLADAYAELALFYRYMNDNKNACAYAEKALKLRTKKYGGLIDSYLDVTYGIRDRMDDIAIYYIGIGELEKAEEYINKMFSDKVLCSWCSRPCCEDAYIRLAQLKILQGDFEGMRSVCAELLEKDAKNAQARVYLENTEELKRQYEDYR
jgi:hypothetical protein